MASSLRAQRIKIGPRLFKVADRFFIRVAVPRALREAYSREGKNAYEIFRPLGTTERREAEQACRRVGAEIDAEFKRKGSELRPVTAAASGARPSFEPIAREVYRSELERLGTLLAGAFDPEEVRERLDAENDLWVLGLTEGVWLKDTTRLADAFLAEYGVMLPEDSPQFAEARRYIARAIAGANRTIWRRAAGDYAYSPKDPVAQPQAAVGITIAELITRYEKDKGAAWTQKTRDGYTLVFRALRELLGAERGVKTITREECRQVRDILCDLAPNYTKLPATRDKPMEEAARVSRELGLPQRTPETVNSYLNNLAALFNYAEAEQLITTHPAKNLRLPTTRKKKDKRQPFSIAQLKAIFGSDLYGPESPRNGRFWVPLLSLWTGMRLNECCQLLTDDIQFKDKVPIILIREDSDDGTDDKRVKTEAGIRYVPIHPELQRIGFLEYWRKMKKAGSRRLFPDLPRGKNGYYSDPFSKRFNRYLVAIGAKAPRTSFHSFRHSYRDALREASISVERVKALGGWANTETQEDYGAGFKPATLYADIKKLRYPGLGFKHLYPGKRAQ